SSCIRRGSPSRIRGPARRWSSPRSCRRTSARRWRRPGKAAEEGRRHRRGGPGQAIREGEWSWASSLVTTRSRRNPCVASYWRIAPTRRHIHPLVSFIAISEGTHQMSRRTRDFPLNAYNPADFAPDPRREARDAAQVRLGSRGRDGAYTERVAPRRSALEQDKR